LAAADAKARFDAFMGSAALRRPLRHFGVAVSGGSDSTALLLLAKDWATRNGGQLSAVTVDHGLREEAAAEASQVGQLCRQHSIPHQTLKWKGQFDGNLQSAAREVRYDLIAGWAQQNGIDAVTLGHTKNDQAETTLLRLLRGSGVDGLAQMQSDWMQSDVRWLRPLLSASREDLRDFLRDLDQPWIDDPSNDDTRFHRVRARQALAALSVLGISQDGLIETSARLRDARGALERVTRHVAECMVTEERGTLIFDQPAFVDLTTEVQNRLLAHALCWTSGHSYRPRFDALQRLKADILNGRTRTLHGCLVLSERDSFRVVRELSTVQDQRCAASDVWDRRWSFDPDLGAEYYVACLGENGLHHVKDWRISGLPYKALLAAPALWKGSELIACPHAGFGTGYVLTDKRREVCFAAAIQTV
jgi:tRNA(Ile)-lysidine synthase